MDEVLSVQVGYKSKLETCIYTSFFLDKGFFLDLYKVFS